MAKINTYKLKEGITKEDLDKLGWREGSWQRQYKDVECISKFIPLNKDIEMSIVIKTNPIEFDDYDDILVLDDMFCQPYTPFYDEDNYKEDVTNFPFLEKVINKYNQAMELQGIFEVVE